MNALIVDDSRLARQELMRLLRDFPQVTVVGEAADADEAIRLIDELRPDLLFLDIQMPGKDGFQLLEQLEDAPEVVFATAYSDYAIKAFESNALDYLLKPIKKERLAAAIAKVEEKRIQDLRRRESADLLTPQSQIFVKDGEACWFVKLADIRLFEVEGSYTAIQFGGARPLIPRSLNQVEARLDPQAFFRANRQQIVNLGWIDRIEPWFSGTLKLVLKDGAEIEVSRRQAAKLKDLTSL